MTRKNR